MKRLQSGLVLVLPLLLTVVLVMWLIPALDSLVRPLLGLFTDVEGIPTVVVVSVGLLIIFIVAILVEAPLFRFVYRVTIKIVKRIPLVGPVYQTFRDATKVLASDEDQEGQSVVVTIAGTKLLGIITVPDVTQFGVKVEDKSDERLVAVYLPMSYQVGGFTVYVPEDQVEKIDWPVSRTLQVVFSAGIVKNVPENPEETEK